MFADDYGAGRSVLLVDDSALMRRMGSHMLARKGFEVVTADDGDTGLAQLKQRAFNIVLSDIQMNRMNGFEFVAAFRRWEALTPEGRARVVQHGRQVFVATSGGAADGEAIAVFDHATRKFDWPVLFRLARGSC